VADRGKAVADRRKVEIAARKEHKRRWQTGNEGEVRK
jgi:hypothetical protein